MESRHIYIQELPTKIRRLNPASEQIGSESRSATDLWPIGALEVDLIIHATFSFLDTISLIACSQVCKKWSAIASRNAFWQKLYLHYLNNITKQFWNYESEDMTSFPPFQYERLLDSVLTYPTHHLVNRPRFWKKLFLRHFGPLVSLTHSNISVLENIDHDLRHIKTGSDLLHTTLPTLLTRNLLAACSMSANLYYPQPKFTNTTSQRAKNTPIDDWAIVIKNKSMWPHFRYVPETQAKTKPTEIGTCLVVSPKSPGRFVELFYMRYMIDRRIQAALIKVVAKLVCLDTGTEEILTASSSDRKADKILKFLNLKSIHNSISDFLTLCCQNNRGDLIYQDCNTDCNSFSDVKAELFDFQRTCSLSRLHRIATFLKPQLKKFRLIEKIQKSKDLHPETMLSEMLLLASQFTFQKFTSSCGISKLEHQVTFLLKEASQILLDTHRTSNSDPLPNSYKRRSAAMSPFTFHMFNSLHSTRITKHRIMLKIPNSDLIEGRFNKKPNAENNNEAHFEISKTSLQTHLEALGYSHFISAEALFHTLICCFELDDFLKNVGSFFALDRTFLQDFFTVEVDFNNSRIRLFDEVEIMRVCIENEFYQSSLTEEHSSTS